MKCPHCNHESGKELVECSQCGAAFERDTVERLGHLEYLLSWLDLNQRILGREKHSRLRQDVVARAETLRRVLHPEEVRPPEEVAQEIHLVAGALTLTRHWGSLEISPSVPYSLIRVLKEQHRRLQEELGERPAEIQPPSELDVVVFALNSLAGWSREGDGLSLKRFEIYLRQKREDLLRPAPEPVPPPVAVPAPIAAVPAVPSQPALPPKPKAPLIDWGRLWQRTVDAAASGALLRGLLYLGAFMIVVSVAILVARFWDIFPAPVQLGFIAAVPAAFYLAGWQVRARLELPQAGTVLTGIGALLVAVDFAAVYQFGGLESRLNGFAYWLGASVFCTALFGVTAWRMRGPFFDAIALLGWCSSATALTQLTNLRLEWSIVSVVASAAAMAGGALSLKGRSEEWADTQLAARWLSLVLIPLGLAMALFGPRDVALGRAVAWAAGTVGFGLLAWGFPAVLLAHAAAWSLVGTVAFAARAAALPLEWFGALAAAVAPLYLLMGHRLQEKLPEERWRGGYLLALDVAWIALVGMGVIWGLIALTADTWPGVVALTLAALVLAWTAYLRRQPLLVPLAGGLLLIPVSAAASRWLTEAEVPQVDAWLMTVWAGLALLYLGLGVALRRAEHYAIWLDILAHLCLPAACIGLLLNYSSRAAWFVGPTLVALGMVMLAYVASTLFQGSGRHPAMTRLAALAPEAVAPGVFLWPLAVLLPVWLTAAWSYIPADWPWLGAALAMLSLAYLGLGQLLVRQRPAYRLPFHAAAYPLSLVAILLALGDPWALLVALLAVVGTLAALSFVYRRVFEVTVGALLFIWPFQLALDLSPLRLHAYSLAYTLLVILGYTPLGRWLDRTHRQVALPVRAIGHCLAAYAVAGSLLGRFEVYPAEIRWIGALVPVLITAWQLFHLWRDDRAIYGWGVVLTGALAFWQTLRLFYLPAPYHAVAWVGLAWGYVTLERVLARAQGSGWAQRLRQPLRVAGDAVCALGVLLTVPGTGAAFFLGDHLGLLPLLLAQALAVAFLAGSAWVRRQRLYAHLASWLSFFPVTLAWIAFGPSLTTAQFAWPWLGWATALLLTGFVLDGASVRYAHGPYLAGYALAGFALVWSAWDRYTNIYTLGGAIALALLSQVAIHQNRHLSFVDLLNTFWGQEGTVARRAMRTGFLFFAAYGFPVWLAQLLRYHAVPLAWRGTALALVAPLYIAFGLAAGRSRSEYTWPLYSAGYALTALGAAVTYQHLELAIYVLALDAAVYAASAVIFRQVFWLYLSTVLGPAIALLALQFHNLLVPAWTAGTLMALAWAYVAAGRWLDWRSAIAPDRARRLSPWAWPFLIPGYVLSAAALAVASGDRALAIGTYSAGVVLYALSAWAFRQPVFLYPAAWLAAVPYFLTVTPLLATRWHGLAWLPLILLYIAIGQGISPRRPAAIGNLRGFVAALPRPEMPFLLLAYALTVSMMALSGSNQLALTLAFAAGAAVYFGSAAIFRHRAWLYPGLLATHLALAAYLAPSGEGPGRPAHHIALPFMLLTWVTALAGYRFDRRTATEESRPAWAAALPQWHFLSHLTAPSWAQPFFLFTALDLILWQVLALQAPETAIILGVASALLVGLLAALWHDRALPYGALSFLAIATGYRLGWTGMTVAQGMAWTAGIGLGLYLLARLVELLQARTGIGDESPLAVWPKPLTVAAVFFSGMATVVALPSITTETSTYAIELIFAGVLYLTIAYRGRYHWLGYLAVAMLQVAWVLMLIVWDVEQPQLYAIPAGLYLVGVGTLERRRRADRFPVSLECFGLAVLLLTSFIQSLNGAAGFPYFLLLLAEGLLVIGWGAWRCIKIPFFVGLGASALNVVAQVVVLVSVYEVNRWFIILGVGLLLVGAAILVERRREQIVSRAQEWRGVVESWE